MMLTCFGENNHQTENQQSVKINKIYSFENCAKCRLTVLNHLQRCTETLRHVLRHLQFDEMNEKLNSVVNNCHVVWRFVHVILRM